MKTFPEEYELIGFFEVEPEISDRDVPWFYNRITFKYKKDSDYLICAFEPGYNQIDIAWEKDNIEVASFSLREINNISISTEPMKEYMEINFKSNEILDFILQLKPCVHIFWGNRELF